MLVTKNVVKPHYFNFNVYQQHTTEEAALIVLVPVSSIEFADGTRSIHELIL